VGNRRIRTIGILAFLAGLVLVGLTLLLEQTGWSSLVTFSLLVLATLIVLRFSPFLYRAFYSSQLVDLPSFLAKRYLPKEYKIDPGSSPHILLLRPPSMIGSAPDCGEALGLGYLASVLRKQDYDVLILDARLMALDGMQTVEALMMYQPPMLGINLNFETLMPVTQEIVTGLRRRGYKGHITLGGLCASVAYESVMQVMPEADTLVRFEGEETYPEFVRKFDDPAQWASIAGLIYRQPDGELVVNPLRRLIPDLDSLPHPARDLLPVVVEYEGFAYVLSSRGCNGVCSYCIQQRSVSDPRGDRWRGRDARDVVNEIETLVNTYGVSNVSFVDDDLFGGNRKGETHAHRLAQAMIERNLNVNLLISVQPCDVEQQVFSLLKQAGLASVILAVDNFSQPVLDRYKKLSSVQKNLASIQVLLDLDLDAYLGIILFDPWTTLQELEENFRVLNTAAIPFFRPWQITEKLAAYHGGSITEKMVIEGILRPGSLCAEYEFQDARVKRVYQALTKMMQVCQPYFSALDRYRWGSIGLDLADMNVRKYCKGELNSLFAQYNQFIAGLALDVVHRQQASDKPCSLSALINSELLLRLKQKNQETMQALQSIRLDSAVASATMR
jgi:radical SAM superfamily enzyme YgiQ (UPF0313 family)